MSRNHRDVRSREGGSRTCKRINSGVAGNTNMAGDPAKADRFTTARKAKEPVLDFCNKRVRGR